MGKTKLIMENQLSFLYKKNNFKKYFRTCDHTKSSYLLFICLEHWQLKRFCLYKIRIPNKKSFGALTKQGNNVQLNF